MPVSAFDAEGRLKKHALAGTSLAVDKDRLVKKRIFQNLYKEARADPNAGREGMLNKLTSRYQAFGQPQTERLAEIASQKAGFEAEAGGLRNLGQEEEFGRYNEWQDSREQNKWTEANFNTMHVPEEIRAATDAAFENMTWQERRDWAREQDFAARGMGYPKVLKTKGEKDDAKWKGIASQTQSTHAATAFLGFSPAGKIIQKLLGKKPPPTEKKYWSKLGKMTGLEKFYKGRMAKNIYEQQQGAEAQKAYQEQISAEVDRINEQYIPLAKEEGEREKRLADRADLYNLFLGG